jgi:hypothetical protein
VNYQKVLKRSWNLVWRYRALWIFGAILALTTCNGFFFVLDPGWDTGGERIAVRVNETSIVYLPGPDLTVDLTDPKHLIRQIDDDDLEELRRFFSGELTAGWIPRGVRAALIAFGVVAASIAVVGLVARYVAEASLIRMVHEGEETGEKPGILRGARLGFSRSAWRLFLIDILINLPLMLVFLLAFMLALLPLLLWVAGSTAAGVTGAFLTAGSLFLLSILSILVSAVVSMFVQVIRRVCAVEGLGVFASIGRGLGMVRRHFMEVLVIWLIWIGTRLAWMVASIPVLIVLSPILLLFTVAGALLGALPALLVGGLLSSVLAGPFPWIVGGLAGLPLFLLVMCTPMLFLGGLVEIFKSSTWTLAYRELIVLECTATDELPASTAATLKAASAS